MSLYLNKKPKYIIYTIENFDEEDDVDGIYDEIDLLEDQINEILKC